MPAPARIFWSIVAAPVMAVLAALSYARSKPSPVTQVVIFVLLIPVIVVVTVLWFMGWSFIVWLISPLFVPFKN